MPEAVSPSARTELLISVAHCGIDDDGPQYRAWAADALRLARELGNVDAQAEALVNLAMLEAGRSQVAASDSEAFRLLMQARELTKQAWAYHPIIKLVIIETHLLCGAGEFERAARAARRGIADAERHGLARTGGAFLAINLAEPLLYLGRWDEAVEVAGRALDLAPPPRTRVGLWTLDGIDRARPGRHRHGGQAGRGVPGGARRRRLRRAVSPAARRARHRRGAGRRGARRGRRRGRRGAAASTTCRRPAPGTRGRCW